MTTQPLTWTTTLSALAGAYALAGDISPAMKLWKAATLWESEWLQDFEALSAEDTLADCPKPAPSHVCDSCGGDLRDGEHQVRIAVDEYRCIPSARERWLDRADDGR